MSLAISGRLTAFVPSEFNVAAAILLLVGLAGGLIAPSRLEGRGGGRIDPSRLKGLIEDVPDVLPYMDCGRGFMVGFLLSVLSDPLLPVPLLLGACILQLVGLCILAGLISPPPAELLGRAPLLNRGAGAAAAALVSMLSPLRVLDAAPLPIPESMAGFLIERVRDGIDVVDMVSVVVFMQVNGLNAPKDAVNRVVARLALLTAAAGLMERPTKRISGRLLAQLAPAHGLFFSRASGVLGDGASLR